MVKLKAKNYHRLRRGPALGGKSLKLIMKVLKQKISSVIALIFVFVFGYFAIYLMDQVFTEYAVEEVQLQPVTLTK